MRASVQESRELPTLITKEEAVVILAKPQIEGAAAEDKFMDCIGKTLAQGASGLRVQSNDEFVEIGRAHV